MYALAVKTFEEEVGTENESTNRQELTKVLQQIELHQGEYYDLWKTTRIWSIDQMKDLYRWASVNFDHWYFESEVDSESLKYAQELLQEGKLIESDGAVGMDLSEEKLGFCLLIKRDGNGLYATKDVLLVKKKFEDYQLDQNVVIVDKRQAHHFKQVFKVVEKIGYPDMASKSSHLEYGYVKLPSGLMKSREGTAISVMDFIENMQQTIIDQYLSRYKGQEGWSQEEILKTATIIANGAIKYGMLKVDPSKDLTFDMQEWLKLDGDTGPYLQYVHARLCGLLNKQIDEHNRHLNFSDSTVYQELTNPAEKALLGHLIRFHDVSVLSAEQFKPSVLCAYLYDLGRAFNHFYAECPIGKLTVDQSQLKYLRLQLCLATQKSMKVGLELLGIEAPEKM